MRKFAFALFILAPLVAEFLLGDFGLNALYALLFLAPMYGGGAIVIREHARRTGRGRPAMILLALAYGVAEEGLVTQSLFNPDYAGLRLLDDWFVPALGIGVPWTITVLAVHTIWSISVPIALVEQLSGPRRHTPWLRAPGLTVAWVLLALGALVNFAGSYTNGHFMASPPQLATAAVIALLLVVVAFRLPVRQTRQPAETAPATLREQQQPGEDQPTQPRTADLPQLAPAPSVTTPAIASVDATAPFAEASAVPSVNASATATVPSAWVVFGLTLVGLAAAWLPDPVPTWVRVAAMVVVFGGGTVAVLRWSVRAGWGDAHRLALAAGATLTYAWHSFLMRPFAGDGPVITPVSHAVFALLAVVLLGFELRSLRRRGRRSRRGGEHQPDTAEPGAAESDTAEPDTAEPGAAVLVETRGR